MVQKQSDIKFYRIRLEQERERQRGASDSRIARVHGEMAERYEALLQEAIKIQGQQPG